MIVFPPFNDDIPTKCHCLTVNKKKKINVTFSSLIVEFGIEFAGIFVVLGEDFWIDWLFTSLSMIESLKVPSM